MLLDMAPTTSVHSLQQPMSISVQFKQELRYILFTHVPISHKHSLISHKVHKCTLSLSQLYLYLYLYHNSITISLSTCNWPPHFPFQTQVVWSQDINFKSILIASYTANHWTLSQGNIIHLCVIPCSTTNHCLSILYIPDIYFYTTLFEFNTQPSTLFLCNLQFCLIHIIIYILQISKCTINLLVFSHFPTSCRKAKICFCISCPTYSHIRFPNFSH